MGVRSLCASYQEGRGHEPQPMIARSTDQPVFEENREHPRYRNRSNCTMDEGGKAWDFAGKGQEAR